MTTKIRIGGVDIERLKGSMRVTSHLNGRSTASFVVVDETGAGAYERGQSVEIFEGLPIPPFIHPLFSGFIDTPRRKRLSATAIELYWSITCIDNHYLADKRIAAESYTGQTAGFIVNALLTKYLVPEGCSAGIVDTGPTIAEMVINYQKLSDALTALAERSGKIWYINRGKELYFTDKETTTAPFAIAATDYDIVRDLEILTELAESSPLYRNREYIRAGKATTALQTENRTGDGETVAFAMGYPLNQEPTITVGGAAQTVGIKGIDTATDWYWNKGDSVITAAVAPVLAAAIVCQYIGEYDIMVMADDLPEQAARQAVEGGTGIVEAIDDEPNLNDEDDALDSAVEKLDYYGIAGKQFTFPIRKWGLEPGQMVTVTHTTYGLNAEELLVESVDISEIAPGELRYMIKAIAGPELGDWTGFFKDLADTRQDVMERITVGSDKILIILTRSYENWEWDESVTETVYACPVVGLALFPALDLYPC